MQSRATDFDAIGARVAACARIDTAWVFGSVARGDATEASDLDLAVLVHDETGDDTDLRALAADLEAFSPSGRVDVVVLGSQGSVFRHRVLREGRVVVDRDPTARQAFETQTIIDYLDWKPTHDIAMEATLDGLRRRFAHGER
jgi:predicted nucleotidyltransferase